MLRYHLANVAAAASDVPTPDAETVAGGGFVAALFLFLKWLLPKLWANRKQVVEVLTEAESLDIDKRIATAIQVYAGALAATEARAVAAETSAQRTAESLAKLEIAHRSEKKVYETRIAELENEVYELRLQLERRARSRRAPIALPVPVPEPVLEEDPIPLAPELDDEEGNVL